MNSSPLINVKRANRSGHRNMLEFRRYFRKGPERGAGRKKTREAPTPRPRRPQGRALRSPTLLWSCARFSPFPFFSSWLGDLPQRTHPPLLRTVSTPSPPPYPVPCCRQKKQRRKRVRFPCFVSWATTWVSPSLRGRVRGGIRRRGRSESVGVKDPILPLASDERLVHLPPK